MMLDAVPVADWRVKYAVRQATATLICREVLVAVVGDHVCDYRVAGRRVPPAPGDGTAPRG
jgi:hypothetical protein